MFGTGARSGRSYAAALRDVSSDRAAVRAEAVPELARHADEHRDVVVPALVAALGDPQAEVRGAAALALADAKAHEALPELIRACGDDDELVRQHALAALGEIGPIGGDAALAAIDASLKAASPAVRFQAVMAYPRASSDREASVQVLRRATHDDDALVRHIALRMAEELGDDAEPVDPTMLARARQLLDDETATVAVAAAVILGRAGSDEGREVLLGVATRELITRQADDEAAALELLGELGVREAIDLLEKRAFEKILLLQNDPFAWQARVALARLRHRRAIDWVVSELGAWNRERRCLAVAAARLGMVAEARPALEAMRGDEARADPAEVEQALAALAGT